MANNFKLDLKVEIPANAGQLLKKASEDAMKVVAAELDGRFTDAMSQSVWAWPRQSKRGTQGITLSETARKWKNASFDTGSPRSIVDSGELKASKVYNLAGTQANWVWSTEYAAAVHDGALIHPWGNLKAAKVQLPARPWTEAVLFGHPSYSGEVYDYANRFTQELNKRLS